jgi:hypothetical protein
MGMGQRRASPVTQKGDSMDTKGLRGVDGPEGDLGEDLVGEGARHDPRRVAGSASEVDETSLSEEDVWLSTH